jgi:hypothetical protein
MILNLNVYETHCLQPTELKKKHQNQIIGYTSLIISGALTNARKRNSDLHHMKTEDQPFPHNSLSAINFSTLDATNISTLDAVPSCSALHVYNW